MKTIMQRSIFSLFIFLFSLLLSFEAFAQTCTIPNIDNCTGNGCQFRYTMDGNSTNNYQMLQIPFSIDLADLPDSCYTGAGAQLSVTGIDTNGLIYNIPSPLVYVVTGTLPRNHSVASGCATSAASITGGYSQHTSGSAVNPAEVANTNCTVVNFNMSNLVALPSSSTYGMSASVPMANILYKKWAVAIPPHCVNTPLRDELVAGGATVAAATTSALIGPGVTVTTYSTKHPTAPSTCSGAALTATCDPIYSGTGRFVGGSALGTSTTCENGCMINGTIGTSVGTRTYYSTPNPVNSCASVSQSRTCSPGNNTTGLGSLSGGSAYEYLTCNDGCGTVDGIPMPNGASHTFYTTSSAFDCTTKTEVRTCTNGSLSGSASFQSCVDTPPPAGDCGVTYRVGSDPMLNDVTIGAGSSWTPLPTYTVVGYGGAVVNGSRLDCQLCSPGTDTAAGCPSITNGSSRKTCSGDGMSWGACSSSCSGGYTQSGSQPNITCTAAPVPMCWSMLPAWSGSYDNLQCAAAIVGSCSTLDAGGGAGVKCVDRAGGYLDYVGNAAVVHSRCRPVSEGNCNASGGSSVTLVTGSCGPFTTTGGACAASPGYCNTSVSSDGTSVSVSITHSTNTALNTSFNITPPTLPYSGSFSHNGTTTQYRISDDRSFQFLNSPISGGCSWGAAPPAGTWRQASSCSMSATASGVAYGSACTGTGTTACYFDYGTGDKANCTCTCGNAPPQCFFRGPMGWDNGSSGGSLVQCSERFNPVASPTWDVHVIDEGDTGRYESNYCPNRGLCYGEIQYRCQSGSRVETFKECIEGARP